MSILGSYFTVVEERICENVLELKGVTPTVPSVTARTSILGDVLPWCMRETSTTYYTARIE